MPYGSALYGQVAMKWKALSRRGLLIREARRYHKSGRIQTQTRIIRRDHGVASEVTSIRSSDHDRGSRSFSVERDVVNAGIILLD